MPSWNRGARFSSRRCARNTDEGTKIFLVRLDDHNHLLGVADELRCAAHADGRSRQATIAVALLVGTVVAGQTFYLFTLENLKQFGALKAIGVTNARLVGMILLQALTAGALGFSIGTGIAATFFEVTGRQMATRGIVLMWQSVALTGAAILIVVAVASVLSIRRVLVLEPASVFRS
jgi:hypothetical protein